MDQKHCVMVYIQIDLVIAYSCGTLKQYTPCYYIF